MVDSQLENVGDANHIFSRNGVDSRSTSIPEVTASIVLYQEALRSPDVSNSTQGL
jgi:hypothetical protein